MAHSITFCLKDWSAFFHSTPKKISGITSSELLDDIHNALLHRKCFCSGEISNYSPDSCSFSFCHSQALFLELVGM